MLSRTSSSSLSRRYWRSWVVGSSRPSSTSLSALAIVATRKSAVLRGARATKRTPYGVRFVALAPLSTADFLVATIASALRLVLDGREDPTTQLLQYLRDKELLLVLDNIEHLLVGTSGQPLGGLGVAAGLVSEIVRQTPRVTLLVTSRERLRLSAEQVYPVSPLALPDPQQMTEPVEALSMSPAVALF